ncbi:membrane protein [Camelimonas fluminis]|uniref:RDD family protein n=1 Tax=Camelimonas fluminis TaxID=1576911 RepID=A0ABV7UMI1_9HYPH|nr:RDD family protein [Camelimonas fluminis]GHE57027.1 membrane protein [Camelimonas fluminis]
MANTDLTTGGQGGSAGGERTWRTSGVLTSRLFAWLIDLVIIALWTVLLAIIVGVLGFLTFGLGWFLFALVVPASGIIYSMVTVGGSRQSTIGMRMLGMRVVRADGGRVDAITAGAHALFFYLAASTGLLWLADVVIGVIDDRGRMGHDYLAGLVVVWND